VDKDTRSTQI
jgi:hypothetical protein